MKEEKETFGLTKWVESVIMDFIYSPYNSLMNEEMEPAWGTPITGFANGSDPIWDTFKGHIGEFYFTPYELFKKTYPETSVTPYELTVISWVLPQTENTKREHGKEKTHPSERWVRSRKFGEDFNVMLRRHVVEVLEEKGYQALAPQLSPFWKTLSSDTYGFSSNWSERHAAYASGLGTFGLCDGLITPVGKAMRCGSVIAKIVIPPTPRPYTDHHEYCLFFKKGTCGRCIKRCPVGAITEKGHDKEKCRLYIDTKMREYVKNRYNLDTYGCGLCQVRVPCESGIPKG
ncbi:MAG: hypothetical protein N2745_10945 [Syntrophorhabdaceae bacterium]|nr:hypothetical protein [Syntrophorhabdaceae bacterium]